MGAASYYGDSNGCRLITSCRLCGMRTVILCRIMISRAQTCGASTGCGRDGTMEDCRAGGMVAGGADQLRHVQSVVDAVDRRIRGIGDIDLAEARFGHRAATPYRRGAKAVPNNSSISTHSASSSAITLVTVGRLCVPYEVNVRSPRRYRCKVSAPISTMSVSPVGSTLHGVKQAHIVSRNVDVARFF